jgi:ectoine hydroxylase-related dioxygenase (phytanoyl-CoA dioxygenase family)
VTPEEILDHPPRLLSQAQREFFFVNGYLLVEQALDAAWLSRLREAFATLEKKGEEPDRPADFEFETLPDGARRLRQVLCAADYHPEIWRYVSSAPMTDIAADLVGPNVQFRESGISFKSPGGRGFDWHQDIVFFPSSNRSPIMTLTFVEDVASDMGPTRVIPGSHLGEVYDHYDAEGHWLGLIGEHVKHRIPVAESVEMTGPAGSVLVTSCGIVHAAGENRASSRRPMVLAGYASADTVSYGGIPYKSRYRWRIVEGEPTREIHSDALRLKLPPDWDAYEGIRIDDLYQRQDG